MRLHIRRRTVYRYASPANGSCPGERHVRTSVGLDYASAAPVRGVRRGRGYETLQVGVQVACLAEQ